ncbi:hypothetical protein [Nocardioides zeae]|uniref:JmjC domain-containing protein n=1 Tax=Nocardioides zeae TaxID=1457234 RepID=A0A6P0HMD2_9ACTN|nr:hypothetical protein [Nocardioides zeae]NEN79781.1 hypothetical protein [Nocardioides zeae]
MFRDDQVLNGSFLQSSLPARSDRNVADYAARINPGGRGSFALTVNSLQQFDWSAWRSLRATAESLTSLVGHGAVGGTDCHAIASAYGEAPTRIHRDTADVVTYVVTGFKRFHLWSRETFRPDEAASFAQVNLDEPTLASAPPAEHVLEGGPGSVFFWPSSYWHCAESDWSNTLTLHLAFYDSTDVWRSIIREMQRIGESRFGTSRYAQDETAQRIASEQALELLISPGPADAVRQKLELRSIARTTASNFSVVPPVIPGRVRGSDVVQATEPSRCLVTTARDGHRFLVANGHVARVDGYLDAAAIADYVDRLRSPQLIEDVPRDLGLACDSAAEVRAISTILYQFGAIERV